LPRESLSNAFDLLTKHYQTGIKNRQNSTTKNHSDAKYPHFCFTVKQQIAIIQEIFSSAYLHICTSAHPHINHPHIRTSKQGRFPR